jgi:hypothetical protein
MAQHGGYTGPVKSENLQMVNSRAVPIVSGVRKSKTLTRGSAAVIMQKVVAKWLW